MPTSFDPSRLPDLSGKTAIVTGANSGIGRATAQALTDAGARVVLAVRSRAKGRAAANSIGGDVEVRHLDLARLTSVRDFAARWSDQRGNRSEIALLINNAAANSPALHRTADGFELQFGTDHLGHFALTNLLVPHITGRVVTVASQAERMGRLDWDDLAFTSGGYTQSKAYNRAKLANLLFTAELQRRFSAARSPVLAQAAHPGFAATDIYTDGGAFTRLLVRAMAQSPAQGAWPVLFAALADIPGNSFIGPRRMLHLRGAPEVIGRSKAAQSPESAARLWSVSEELTGISWNATVPAA